MVSSAKYCIADVYCNIAKKVKINTKTRAQAQKPLVLSYNYYLFQTDSIIFARYTVYISMNLDCKRLVSGTHKNNRSRPNIIIIKFWLYKSDQVHVIHVELWRWGI